MHQKLSFSGSKCKHFPALGGGCPRPPPPAKMSFIVFNAYVIGCAPNTVNPRLEAHIENLFLYTALSTPV